MISFRNPGSSNFCEKQLFITKENNLRSLITEVYKVVDLIKKKLNLNKYW